MKILGIETSCDETAAAIIDISGRKKIKFKILSNIVASQVHIHQKYGGIVPEVAARAHIEKIILIVQEACQIAKTSMKNIDLIGVTQGPGLITSLLVGLETAKSLSFVFQKPLIGVNHLSGHIYTAFADYFFQTSSLKNKNIFPAIALVVSGGHTELFLMKDWVNFKKIGQTLDDAAGECFDKVAKLLNLGYPGGPIISRRASQATKKLKDFELELPRPMLNVLGYDFSFSGLKTAVLYLLQNKKNQRFLLTEKDVFVNALCFEVQQAAIDVLVSKTLKAALKYKVKSVILGGGVVANQELRQQMAQKIDNSCVNFNFLVPPREFCTDNALMIAMASYFKWKKRTSQQKKIAKTAYQSTEVDSNLGL